MSIETKFFDYTNDKKEISSLILKNKNGAVLELLTLGATIRSLLVPDKNGNLKDVVIGHNSASQYEKHSYQGATIGRYANRIAKGKFSLDGVTYTLDTNNGPNHLHGGPKGYHLNIWEVENKVDSDEPSVTFSHLDPDMFEGFPGNVNVKVTFTLTYKNEVVINYKATTDKKTILNMTNHSFFNLNGYDSGIATEQFIKINADGFTPVDEALIPTGEIKSVDGTAFDFRSYKTIQQDIEKDDADVKIGGGYDHNFVLNTKSLKEEAASAYSTDSGIKMTVYTDMPGVQLYTGNFLDGKQIGKDDKPINFRTGYCFETQFFPDSPNQPTFPSCILNPNEEYNKTTIYKFDII